MGYAEFNCLWKLKIVCKSLGLEMKITLSTSDFGCFLIQAEDGRDILIQSDWEFPGLASTFGWVHAGGSAISEARDFLDEHIGDSVEDPGYFE